VLKFSLASTHDAQPQPDLSTLVNARVILVGLTGDTIFYFGSTLPRPMASLGWPGNPSWQSYSINLSEAGWSLRQRDAAKKHLPVTHARFCQVLRTLSAILIQAEFTTQIETDALDYVAWNEPLPKPGLETCSAVQFP
jgi:hypothetical protein